MVAVLTLMGRPSSMAAAAPGANGATGPGGFGAAVAATGASVDVYPVSSPPTRADTRMK
jgi:hypothetical protein